MLSVARGVRYTISSDFDNKGVRAAEKGILALGKSALKATVGITSASMAVQKLNRFLQESVQAAIADEKAYKVLGQTLESAGFTQATQGVKNFIDAQQLATGVAEDQLIPAYTTLFNALQSIAKAQDTLQLAQSVAIATGKDLSAVTSAFAKAAVGSTTSLQRLGIGISKAELAAGDFDSILRKLERRFGSTTAAAIDTTAVRFDRLKVAVSEAKEEIGKGLVDAFDLLAREAGQDIDALQAKIISIGTTVGDFARGVGVLAGKLREVANIQIAGGSLLSTMLKISPSGFIWSKIAELLVKVGKAEREAAAIQNLQGINSYFGVQAQMRQEKLAAAARAKELARQKALEQAKLARERATEAQRKKAAALDAKTKELAQQFDLELIGLAAAKKRQVDDETMVRLTALQALAQQGYNSESNSIEDLDRLLKKLAASQQAYTDSINASATAWTGVANAAAAAQQAMSLIQSGKPAQIIAGGNIVSNSLADLMGQMSNFQATLPPATPGLAAPTPPSVTVINQGPVIGPEAIDQMVQDAVNRVSRSGGRFQAQAAI